MGVGVYYICEKYLPSLKMKRRIFIKFKEKIIDYIKYNQFNATKTYNKKFRVSKRVMCSHPLLHLLHSCELEQGVVIIQNLAHKGGVQLSLCFTFTTCIGEVPYYIA